MATSISDSGTTATSPSGVSRSTARPACGPSATHTTPRRICTGVLGMIRTTSAPAYARATSASGTPPSSEITSLPCVREAISPATSSSWTGLWARTIVSAFSARSAFAAATSPPTSSTSACARAVSTSPAITGCPSPRASALPMLPLPISPSMRRGSLRLVEEALFDQPRALLRRDLDVARREHEHLVGDPLHAAVEGVGQPAGEVDEALGEVGVGALQVEDDRDVVLEAVGHLLGVVEGLGDDQVHAHVARAAAVDRPHAAGRPARGLVVVVGEDVVELVAAAAQAADVGPVGVAVLQLGLGLTLALPRGT